MNKNRMEAFSDGVLAIIITIMVLELKVPHGTHFTEDLLPLAPKILSYALSFIYIGIYWNNHHHLFQVVQKISGAVLWANLHLLFWLSLVPFVTAWAGEHDFRDLPVACYGFVLMACGIAYYILVKTLVASHGSHSPLVEAIGNDFKGKISVVLYVIAIALAFWHPWIACAIYVTVAAIWFVPDRRIERVLPKAEI